MAELAKRFLARRLLMDEIREQETLLRYPAVNLLSCFSVPTDRGELGSNVQIGSSAYVILAFVVF